MKIIIQIPCYNEASTLPATIRDLPTNIAGIDAIEYLVIDDGSTDGTADIAASLGVHHVISNKTNIGLARSFARGLDYALMSGADIVVNTDGDNQYAGSDIARLVEPILAGRAEVVIGDRQTARIAHFSPVKKALQTFGSAVVRTFSGVMVPDAVSGFRAISRSAGMRINIVSSFSYTIEMLIQVGRKGISYESVPIATNAKTRDSRLFKSIFQFIERSGTTALRMYAMYAPLRIFSLIGIGIALFGSLPILRFVYFYLNNEGEGKVQSLVLGCALMTAGVIAFILGLLADLLGRNRQLIELTLERVRDMDYRLSLLDGNTPSRIEEKPVTQKLEDGRDGKDHEETDRIIDMR